MPRKVLSKERQVAFINTKPGKKIIFCEGHTEKNYIAHFTDELKAYDRKSADTVIEVATVSDDDIQIDVMIAGKGGNARHVLNYANRYFAYNENAQKYIHYENVLFMTAMRQTTFKQ